MRERGVERGHHFLPLAALHGGLDPQRPRIGLLLAAFLLLVVAFGFGRCGRGCFGLFLVGRGFFGNHAFDRLAANLYGHVARLGIGIVKIRSGAAGLSLLAMAPRTRDSPRPAARAGTPSTTAEARNTR